MLFSFHILLVLAKNLATRVIEVRMYYYRCKTHGMRNYGR